MLLCFIHWDGSSLLKEKSYLLSKICKAIFNLVQPTILAISSYHQLHAKVCCFCALASNCPYALLHLQYLIPSETIPCFLQAQVLKDVTASLLNCNFILLFICLFLWSLRTKRGISLKSSWLAQHLIPSRSPINVWIINYKKFKSYMLKH